MMKRKEKRRLMEAALKNIVVPFLRDEGFKGSMPHFRRIKEDRINLITFQHSLDQAKFVIEVSNCPPTGITMSWGEQILPKKVTAHHMYKRLRLGTCKINDDYWFDYSTASLFFNIFNKQAKQVLNYWDQAKTYWSDDPYDQRIE